MLQPRAADDFAAIRARMEELRREREPAPPGREVVAPRPYTASSLSRALERLRLSPVTRRLLGD
jgi:hypothetical protein